MLNVTLQTRGEWGQSSQRPHQTPRLELPVFSALRPAYLPYNEANELRDK
jgi:hypothetical protein